MSAAPWNVRGPSRECAEAGGSQLVPRLSAAEEPLDFLEEWKGSSRDPVACDEPGGDEDARPTVHIVDDEPEVRQMLAELVHSVGLPARTFASADAFRAAYDPLKPGCLLLDVRMPGTSGLELLEALHDREQAIPVIVVTGHADVPLAIRAIRAGAVDLVEKPFRNQTLLESINHALALDAERRQAHARRAEYTARHALLTQREQEVMTLLLAGREVKEIAGDLGLSHKTVQIHRAHVLEKMGVKSIANLVRFAASVCLGVDKPLP